jgi:hypothetical protein
MHWSETTLNEKCNEDLKRILETKNTLNEIQIKYARKYIDYLETEVRFYRMMIINMGDNFQHNEQKKQSFRHFIMKLTQKLKCSKKRMEK